MTDLETRELRYFVAVAEELHFGRAAELLGMAQPPLSRAVRHLEQRLGVQLFVRTRRSVALTEAGSVLLHESGRALDAIAAAARRTQRAGRSEESLILATKAGASHEILQRLLDALACDPNVPKVDVLMGEVGDQALMLRDGRADVALMHSPVDDLAGLDTEELFIEGQVAIVPAAHPLATRKKVTMDELREVTDPPLARWPLLDGTYPDGRGPEVRTQSQIAQLVALGQAILVIPESSRAWQWPEHAAIPVVDAPQVTTVIAWPATRRSRQLAELVRAATSITDASVLDPESVT